MVDVAVDVAGGDQSTILIRDPESEQLVLRAHRNVPPEALARADGDFARLPPARGKPRPRYMEDVHQASKHLPELIDAAATQAIAELPILVEDEVLGYFHIGFDEPREFTSDEKRLFESLAGRAALAIHNAQLYERSQQTASLEERQRLARELHDSVSQALYGIALGTRTARKWLDRDPSRVAEPLDYALVLAEVGLAEMRALIFELRPESLETEGLVAALQRQVAALSARYELEIVANLCEEPELQPRVREALYRIAQEAMHNTVKHASATRIDLSLSADAAGTCLTVRDNGKGFDPTGDFPGHLGLRSMRERAQRLGGGFELDSVPGEGTRIVVTTPPG
jgi:signal transduction histidine kinase